MAEAVAVVGLVASIVQLVEIGTKIIARVNDFTSKTNDVPKSFVAVAKRLTLFNETLRQVRGQLEAGVITETAAKVLKPVIDNSLLKTQELITLIDQALPAGTSSKFVKGIKALKSLKYDGKVQKIVAQLEKDIQAFVFHQTTAQTDIVDRMRQDLSRLNVAANTPALGYELGLCLGEAPQIDATSFVGRDTELAQLRELLTPRLSPPVQNVVALSGMGGVGKTQLSLAFGRQNQGIYSSVLWINAKDESAVRQDFLTLSRRLFPQPSGTAGSSKDADKEEAAVQRIRKWLSDDGNDRWLLILDNYDDPSIPGMKSTTGFDVRLYFPYRSQGSILITTRSSRLTFALSLRLQKLEKVEESLAILSERSGRDLNDDKDAISLSRRLEGLPLALVTAGAYLRQSPVSVKAYLELYEESWDELSDDAEELAEYENRTLFSTWNLSLAHVRAKDQNAAEMMCLLAYFDNQDIWYELLCPDHGPDLPWVSAVTKSKIRFDSTMRRLHDYSLVEVSAVGYSLHTCIHDWTLQALNRVINPKYYWTALNCIVSSLINRTERDYWQTNRRSSGHVARLEHSRFSQLMTEEQLNLDRCSDLHCLGDLYLDHGKLEKAEEMYQRALVGYEKALGPDHAETLTTVNNLGNLYRTQGKLERAEEMYQRALVGKEKALGPDHAETLTTVNNLGNLYRTQGKLEKAEEMYQRALVGTEKALGPDHAETLTTVNNLGNLYADQGKLEKAEEMYQRALVGYEKALRPDHALTLITVNNLGNLYADQGKLEKAEEMYQRALVGYEKALGPDHTLTLTTVSNLGSLYSDQNKLEEAEEMYQRALAGFRSQLGAEHRYYLKVVDNLQKLSEKQASAIAGK